MKTSPLKSSRAFTLVELIVGMTLSLMVMAAVLSSYVFLARNFTRTLGIASADQPNLEAQTRRLLANFARDVRMASAISGTPSATTVTLLIPSGADVISMAYAYDVTDSTNKKLFRGVTWDSAKSYVINDTVVWGGTGYRCILGHSNQEPPNISYWTTATPAVSNLLSFSFTYYDSAGRPYTTFVNYLSGIKQVSFTLTSQTGRSGNGTLSPVFQTASPRLIVRNKPLLN